MHLTVCRILTNACEEGKAFDARRSNAENELS